MSSPASQRQGGHCEACRARALGRRPRESGYRATNAGRCCIYFSSSIRVHFHSENGIMGHEPVAGRRIRRSLSLTDAGGRPVGAMPGACAFDSAFSFGLIRGGHLDVTVLGGLEVDEKGQLANWMVPGKEVAGMGGAMDLNERCASRHRRDDTPFSIGIEAGQTLFFAHNLHQAGRSCRHRACSNRTHGGGTSASRNRAWRYRRAGCSGHGCHVANRVQVFIEGLRRAWPCGCST